MFGDGLCAYGLSPSNRASTTLDGQAVCATCTHHTRHPFPFNICVRHARSIPAMADQYAAQHMCNHLIADVHCMCNMPCLADQLVNHHHSVIRVPQIPTCMHATSSPFRATYVRHSYAVCTSHKQRATYMRPACKHDGTDGEAVEHLCNIPCSTHPCAWGWRRWLGCVRRRL